MEYFKIGKLVAVYGLKGELLLRHTLQKKISSGELQVFFMEEKKNLFLPWFIEKVKIKNKEEIFLKLETIDTREAAMRFIGKELWLPEPDFKKFSSRASPVSLLGYTIITEKEDLGNILEVIEQPHQLLCRLDIRGKEVLVPLHEGSLKKIDHRRKQVLVTLPDGLLDIYLT